MCSSDENKDRELIEEMNANYEEALCHSPFPGAAGDGEGHGDEEVHLPGAWIAHDPLFCPAGEDPFMLLLCVMNTGAASRFESQL